MCMRECVRVIQWVVPALHLHTHLYECCVAPEHQAHVLHTYMLYSTSTVLPVLLYSVLCSTYPCVLLPPCTAADRYMAPEVFRHELYNHKVDQYAFAMIAYQLFQVWGNWLSSSGLTGCCFDWGHTHTHTHTHACTRPHTLTRPHTRTHAGHAAILHPRPDSGGACGRTA